MSNLSRYALILVVAMFFCPGCLVMGNKTKILRKNEVRTIINFENEEARDLFHSKAKRKISQNKTVHDEALVIPFIVAYHTNAKLSEAARYNDEILQCDSDGDGLVTEQEAKVYKQY